MRTPLILDVSTTVKQLIDEAYVEGYNHGRRYAEEQHYRFQGPPKEPPLACVLLEGHYNRCGAHWYMPLYPDGLCAEGLGR